MNPPRPMNEFLDKLNAMSILLGALITGFIAWVIHRWDLRTKKKFMNDELIDKMEVILRLEKQTQELITKFETLDIKTYSSDVFEDLYLDIYESVSKDDLYKIYKKNLPALVKVYKKIEFLKTMSLLKIYIDYINKWEAHRVSSEHNQHFGRVKDGIYCDTNMGYMEITKTQLKNNMEAIKNLKRDINKVLEKKFYWMNPLNNL